MSVSFLLLHDSYAEKNPITIDLDIFNKLATSSLLISEQYSGQ